MDFAARLGPATIWIELTSKCPLRCVFCSRENLRGEGEHMDVAMIEPILNSLDDPEIIRLNYSGESGNYPWLIEAIESTKAITRAQVEMVTSLVSMPVETVRRLAGSGIDRVSVSLHSMDEKSFPILYGGGTLESFERRLETLLRETRRQARPPVVDFATVALDSNAIELPRIAAMAAQGGASLLSIHPVIRRPGVPAGFEMEADEDGSLSERFRRKLDSSVQAAREANPAMQISVARPADLGDRNVPFTCEQNPFETVHILSNGDVVPCEVLDRQPLGNLRCSTLRDVWSGPEYRNFRDRYARNEIPECAGCIFRTPATKVGAARVLWGWHDRDESGTVWSRTTASFECEPRGSDALVLTGVLPPGPQSNRVEFLRDGQAIAFVKNDSGEPIPFRVELPLADSSRVSRFLAQVEHGFSPWRRGLSNDARELGFALESAELASGHQSAPVCSRVPRTAKTRQVLKRNAADVLLKALAPLQRLAATSPAIAAGTLATGPEDSLGVIIPERGNVALLSDCLAALDLALRGISIRHEVAVVVNGSRRDGYGKLMGAYPRFRFVFIARPLGFNAAIREGLRHITAGWTYLLNNDMRLAPDALSKILAQRAADVFSLASSIQMTDGNRPRETNHTAIEFIDGLANLRELEGATSSPVEHYYSGGGSSLFQTERLRQFVGRTACYDPFYWEDVEWGVWGKAAGLRNIFVPESGVQHAGQATVRRFYEAAEVSRIFERNRIQFQLRCIPIAETSAIRERLANAPGRTILELLQPQRIASMARARSVLFAP